MNAAEVVESGSAAETEALGARIAERLSPGDVVLLSGDLGAGKTTLIRGACRALGIAEPVTSPTFTIGQRYGGGRLPVSHLDLYRLADLEGEDPALLDDYLGREGVAFVEWPDAGAGRLGRPAVVVRLAHVSEERRRIEVEWQGKEPGAAHRSGGEGVPGEPLP
jgi:tRNA threonylcarbamoyladenosine biosynthesis protein TsaE